MIQDGLFLLLLFVANFIQSITGFGGNMISMPIAVRLMDIEKAKVIMNLFFAAGSFLIAYKNRKYINYKVLKKMLIGMIAGMITGMVLFHHLPLSILLRWYALFLIVVAVKKMFDIWKEENIKVSGRKGKKLNATLGGVILLASGILQGMLLSGGSLLVIYAITQMKEKNEFRATVSAVWVVLGGIMGIWHGYRGSYRKDTFFIIGLSLICLLFSKYLGEVIYQKIDQRGFLKLTYALVFVAGITLLI